MLFMLRFFICKDKAYKNASIIIKSLSENINDEEEPKKVHLITIDEATQLVEGITKYQLRKLIKSREIPSIQGGKKIFINTDILLRYFNNEPE